MAVDAMTLTASTLLALVIAALIGLSLGALGGGGSIITLPVLVYVARVPVHAAVEMSIAIVGVTSLVGAYLHYRQGHMHFRATLLFAVAGGVGAYFGSGLTHVVRPYVLMLIFAVVMLSAGLAMLRAPQERYPGARCRPVRCLAIGAAVGLLTGSLGVGGGFLMVPSLILLAGLETRQAVGTSLAVMSLNSVSGFVGHLGHPALDAKLTLAFLAVALFGLLLGLRLAGRLSERSLRRIFSWLVIVMSVVIGSVNLRRLILGLD